MRQVAVTLLLWLASAVPGYAQQSPIPVLGWLTPPTAESYRQGGIDNPGLHLLRESLARHGLVDGKNIRVDMRLAEGNLDLLPGLAEALVHEGATVILAYGEPA